jgi:hypothetical protein
MGYVILFVICLFMPWVFVWLAVAFAAIVISTAGICWLIDLLLPLAVRHKAIGSKAWQSIQAMKVRKE